MIIPTHLLEASKMLNKQGKMNGSTGGNQHSGNTTVKHETETKAHHARGSASKQCVTVGGAGESCWDDWVNTVRLASDRASTGCWQRPCPFSHSPDQYEPLQEDKIHNNHNTDQDDVPRTWSAFNCPPRYTCPAATATGLASPHQSVSWQNRKAAVCSRHLKVHLHTFPVPTRSVSPKPSPPGQREWATDTRGHVVCFFFFFSILSHVTIHCFFKLCFFFYLFFPNLTRHKHFTSSPPPTTRQKPKGC